MAQTTINLDPSGDLKIVLNIKDEQKTVIVSSKAICLASPVWRAMLNPESGFREATSADRTIRFPDDDAETLLMLFRICHLRFSEIPQKVGLDQLLKTAVLCNKYDIIALVRPWASNWQELLLPQANKDNEEKWLSISWTFRDNEIFRRVVARLVLESEGPGIGKFEGSGKGNLGVNAPPAPPGVVATILNTRQTTLRDLLQLCYHYVDRFDSRNCRSRHDQMECNSLVLGSRILALRQIKLLPKRVNAYEIDVSVRKFAEGLLKFEFLSSRHSDGVKYCDGTELFHTAVNSILSRVRSDLPQHDLDPRCATQ